MPALPRSEDVFPTHDENGDTIPQVDITLESVDVTPETADQIACDLITKWGPAHLKYRYTLNVFTPPYATDAMLRVAGVAYQRDKIMRGEVTKLFYMTVKENY